MPSPTVAFVLRISLIASAMLTIPAAQALSVTPDRGTTITISRVTGSRCTVCIAKAKCFPFVELRNAGAATLEFTCSKPQEEFSVDIHRDIECSTTSCNGHIVQTDSGSLPLMDFKRTFTWNLTGPAQRAFRIDFGKTGLRQIKSTESCPDKHTYTVTAFQATGNVAIGTFCRGGTISALQLLNKGRLSLVAPGKEKLHPALYDVSVGEEIKSLAKIKLTLPEGTSETELLSPNHPDSFPDDDVIEWEIQVLPKHNTTVRFLEHTRPRCLKKDTAVEYHPQGRVALVLALNDPQLSQQDNFTLTLRNCKMDMSRAGSSGLSLHFKVSSVRTSFPVLCHVDLRKERGVSLSIEKIRPSSNCELKMNSVIQTKIDVPSGKDTLLSFQDCSPEDVQVIARKVIECHRLKDCQKAPESLTVPALPRCLPAPLSRLTWILRAPPHGTVELLPPTGSLRQSLPGQPCNDSMILNVAEDGGPSLGQFCPQGSIQTVQIHSNVSVTVSHVGNRELQPSSKALLMVNFKEEISESYIFTVSLKNNVPVFLATPGWPEGMKLQSTVSWIVSVPSKKEAHLMFTNVSQPKCSNRHTNIRVQGLGSLEEMYSRREDEEAATEISAHESFYLNMSNCMPERGQFSVVTKVTLHKNTNLLLTIILSVVAVLLVLMTTVLTVVCVVIRKKKRKLNHQVSIYNPNGTVFLPGRSNIRKSPEENEYHIYDSIEDTLVYTHLLKQGEEMGMYREVDTYRPFTGPTGPPKGPPQADIHPEHAKFGVYQSYVPTAPPAPPPPNRPQSRGRSMVDNELYSSDVPGKVDDSQDPTKTSEQVVRLEPEGKEGTEEKA